MFLNIAAYVKEVGQEEVQVVAAVPSVHGSVVAFFLQQMDSTILFLQILFDSTLAFSKRRHEMFGI